MGGGARYLSQEERDAALDGCITMPIVAVFLVLLFMAIVSMCCEDRSRDGPGKEEPSVVAG